MWILILCLLRAAAGAAATARSYLLRRGRRACSYDHTCSRTRARSVAQRSRPGAVRRGHGVGGRRRALCGTSDTECNRPWRSAAGIESRVRADLQRRLPASSKFFFTNRTID